VVYPTVMLLVCLQPVSPRAAHRPDSFAGEAHR
jgi:hypothetical protein